jgi:hypothetical protein
VQAGEDAARRIRGDAGNARPGGDRGQARQQAATVVADADQQATEILNARKAQLDLARTLVRLRDSSIARSPRSSPAAAGPFKDTGFLKDLLRELVVLYARRDAAGGTEIEVNVGPEVRSALADWAMGGLRSEPGAAKGVSLELTSSLEQAGFEYTVEGATVEVTLASVAAMLSELVGPELRTTIDRALAEKAG